MNRRKLVEPAIAVMFLTLALAMSSMPAFAAVGIGPRLEVLVIPEYDQVRKTGILVLGLTPSAGWSLPSTSGSNLVASYKIAVSYNGIPFSWDPLNPQNGVLLACAVLQKIKVNPADTAKQFPEEQLETKLVDVSQFYVCKVRWSSASGFAFSTGVLDVYYVGSLTTDAIGDNILTIQTWIKLGNTLVFGVGVQDVCVIGWAVTSRHITIALPDASTYHTWDNPLGPFSSCGAAALAQRSDQGLSIQSTTTG